MSRTRQWLHGGAVALIQGVLLGPSSLNGNPPGSVEEPPSFPIELRHQGAVVGHHGLNLSDGVRVVIVTLNLRIVTSYDYNKAGGAHQGQDKVTDIFLFFGLLLFHGYNILFSWPSLGNA